MKSLTVMRLGARKDKCQPCVVGLCMSHGILMVDSMARQPGTCGYPSPFFGECGTLDPSGPRARKG